MLQQTESTIRSLHTSVDVRTCLHPNDAVYWCISIYKASVTRRHTVFIYCRCSQEVHQRLDAVQGLVQKEMDRPPLIIRQAQPRTDSGALDAQFFAIRHQASVVKGMLPTQATALNAYG